MNLVSLLPSGIQALEGGCFIFEVRIISAGMKEVVFSKEYFSSLDMIRCVKNVLRGYFLFLGEF